MDEENLVKYQKIQQELESIAIQASAIQQALAGYEEALNEMEKSNGKLYKLVGTLLIETTKEAAQKEINEKKEELNLRLEMLKKRNEKLLQMEKELREKIQKEGKGE
jgi:prefoldin beta subunit